MAYDLAKAGGAAVGGGVAGAGTYAAIGGIGVAVGGTAVGITLVPFVVLGSVLGLAGYGLYWLGKQAGADGPPTAAPCWLVVDYPTSKATAHIAACRYTKERTETELKGVGSLREDGGWLLFSSLESAQAFVNDPMRGGPRLTFTVCADCLGERAK